MCDHHSIFICWWSNSLRKWTAEHHCHSALDFVAILTDLRNRDRMFFLNWIIFEAVKVMNFELQQGLKIQDLEEWGPRRYKVFNWIQIHLRYTDFDQKPWRYTVFDFLLKKNMHLRCTDFGQMPWRCTVFDFLIKNYAHSFNWMKSFSVLMARLFCILSEVYFGTIKCRS